MRYIKLFEDFVLENKGSITKHLVDLDPELYRHVLEKSKNEDFKKVIGYVMDGLTVSAAIQKLHGRKFEPRRRENRIDYLKFITALTKDEKIYIYHLKNAMKEPVYSSDGIRGIEHSSTTEKFNPRSAARTIIDNDNLFNRVEAAGYEWTQDYMNGDAHAALNYLIGPGATSKLFGKGISVIAKDRESMKKMQDIIFSMRRAESDLKNSTKITHSSKDYPIGSTVQLITTGPDLQKMNPGLKVSKYRWQTAIVKRHLPSQYGGDDKIVVRMNDNNELFIPISSSPTYVREL